MLVKDVPTLVGRSEPLNNGVDVKCERLDVINVLQHDMVAGAAAIFTLMQVCFMAEILLRRNVLECFSHPVASDTEQYNLVPVKASR